MAFTDKIKRFLMPATISSADVEWKAAYNKERHPSLHGSYCFAPSVNMVFSQTGEVNVCCHNRGFILGKWPNESIADIWKGEKAEELRAYMRQYDLLHGCHVCEFEMSQGNFNDVPARHFDQLPRHPQYPTMMEFQLSNKCNLECVMCTGEFSSLIRKNREKLPAIESPYDERFLQQVEEFIPHLAEARFSSSGEAFSIDINYKLWEMIIRLNPGCRIMIQTNGTILTERAKDILAKGNFEIGVSLDSLDKATYEKIRLNANHTKVMENIRWFSEYAKGGKTRFMLALCVMRQNWHELPAYIEFCNQLGAFVVLHKVWEPHEFALHNLKASELERIVSYLRAFMFPETAGAEQHNSRQYRLFVSVVDRWHKDAVKREEELFSLDNVKEADLKQALFENIRHHITRYNWPSAEAQRVEEVCFSKLNGVLAEMNDAERNTLLRKWYFINPALMVEPLRDSSLETLVAAAKKSLVQNEFTRTVVH